MSGLLFLSPNNRGSASIAVRRESPARKPFAEGASAGFSLAEIFVFDDSFSALDMKTDSLLRQNLKENIGEAPMIVVAQRVNTIMDATRILVLEDGEIVGMGTHKELLSSCKLYREIAEIQLGEEEVKHELASA